MSAPSIAALPPQSGQKLQHEATDQPLGRLVGWRRGLRLCSHLTGGRWRAPPAGAIHAPPRPAKPNRLPKGLALREPVLKRVAAAVETAMASSALAVHESGVI
jgi:hypothetical protein